MACASDDAKKRHGRLFQDIHDHVDTNSENYDIFTNRLKSYLPKGVVARTANKLFDLLELMVSRGKMAIGNYEILKEIVKDFDVELLEIIETAEKEIKGFMKQSSSHPSSVHHQAGNAVPKTRSETPVANRGTKRAREPQEDEAEPLYANYNGKQFYDTTGKKGLLLILNYTNNRNGTHIDVINLRRFFVQTLLFDVEDPRSTSQRDLTLAELNKCLEDIRHRLNDPEQARKYYCFFCVILSHGNEKGIATSDGQQKPIDEIRKAFTNDKLEGFKGKPKVFFIQACRGYEEQSGHETEDQADDIHEQKTDEPQQDEADEIFYIPTDADVLIAYATTPGYKAFRRTKGEKRGSWFVTAAIETFEESYAVDHVEEMFITIRDKVAAEFSTSRNARQMPCTWSTLTKRLKLGPS